MPITSRIFYMTSMPSDAGDTSLEQVRQERRLALSIAEIAAAVTSIRDDSAAMQQLVTRTRTLLGVDMAYLSLNDEAAAHTRIVETDGVWTSEYRDLRMPLGAGVLGRVAQSGGPVQTYDYASDAMLVHDPEVDRIVEAEGVRAILGAPMRIAGRVIGALMVANRVAHRFDDEQIFVAQTLANLAAVAIDNTRRLDELTDAASRERARAEDLAADLVTTRRVVDADDALVETIASSGGLAELRDGMTRALGREVRLVDLTVRYDIRDAAAEVGDAERPLIALSARSGAAMNSSDEAGDPFAVMAAMRGDEPVGAVLVDGVLAPGDEVVLQRCARMLGAYLSAQDRERGDLARRRRELVDLLLAPPPSGLAPVAVRQLGDYGVRAGEPFRILVGTGSDASLRDFDHRLELDFGLALLRTRVEGEVVCIVPERAFVQIERELEGPGTRRRGGLLVGHSPALHMLDIVPEEFALVQRVLDAARKSEHPRTLVSLLSYGAIGAFLSRVTIEPTKQAIADTIGPLIDYDREHRTALCDTAAAYLDAGHSVARAAERLLVHENTVRQRLERIEALLGEGWSLGQQGLDHHIMLAANRLVGE